MNLHRGTCVVCAKPFLRQPQSRYCLPCVKAVCRLKGVVYKATREAVEAGLLMPPKQCLCVDCGKQAFSYDHRDYTRPLFVEPVCRSCNKRRGPATSFPDIYPDDKAAA